MEGVMRYEPYAELPDHPVDNRDVFPLDFIDDNLADFGFLDEVAVPKEKEVSSLKCRLH